MDGFPAFGLQVAAFGVSLGAGLFAFDHTHVRASFTGRALAALPLGSAIWAAPFLAGAWPAGVQFDPIALAGSLAVAVATVVWGLFADDRAEGHLRIIGPGAILGAGMGLSHGAALLAIAGAGDSPFDDARFCAGVAIATAFCVLAFVFLCRGRPHPVLLASASAAIGTTVCALLASGALALAATPLADHHRGGLTPETMIAASGSLALALLAATGWLRRPARISPATRAPAWRGSRRPAPAPRRAGTASPRPSPARSTAGPAADLERPAQPAR